MNPVAAFRRCLTPADFYRVQITLENFATMTDLLALEAQSESLPQQARDWLGRLLSMTRAGYPEPQVFERRAHNEHATVFRGVGSGSGPRRLLAVFCGAYPFRPLAIPMAPFLQHVAANHYDVIVFRDVSQVLYLKGVPGFGDDIPGIASHLAGLQASEGYAGIRCLGMSAGGAAALVVANLAGAEVAVEFGGVDPAGGVLRRQVAAAGFDHLAFDRILANAPAALRAQCLCVHAAGNAVDHEGALTLQRLMPWALRVAVPDTDEHLVPYELLKRRRLLRFLEGALFDARPDWSRFNPSQAPSN